MNEFNSGLTSMDEFAQTRGADDLFEDEIVPIAIGQRTQEFSEITSSEQRPEEANAAPRWSRGSNRGSGHSEDRDGGRGRSGGGRTGKLPHDRAQKSDPAESSSDWAEEVAETNEQTQPLEVGKEKPATEEPSTLPKPPGAFARTETPRVQAVRGDRSSTGGIKKPKLTEEELVQRIAAAKLNAAKVAAAYARAEADEASFQQREKLAEEMRHEEYLNRRDMDGERERNRLRKLGTQPGREWDADKREEDYNNQSSGSHYRRGMHGAVLGFTRRHEGNGKGNDAYNYSTRGRGEQAHGRGSFHGDKRSSIRTDDYDHPAVAEDGADNPGPTDSICNDSEFPALPEAENTATSRRVSHSDNSVRDTGKAASPPAPPPETQFSYSGGSWGDEVPW